MVSYGLTVHPDAGRRLGDKRGGKRVSALDFALNTVPQINPKGRAGSKHPNP